MIEAAFDIPITAEPGESLVCSRGIWLVAAEIDDVLDAVFTLVFPAQDEGPSGDLDDGSDVGAAEGLGICLDPPYAAAVTRAAGGSCSGSSGTKSGPEGGEGPQVGGLAGKRWQGRGARGGCL